MKALFVMVFISTTVMAQAPASRNRNVALSPSERAGIINSMASARRSLFGANFTFDGCNVARAIGDSLVARGRVTPALRAATRGGPGHCPGARDLVDPKTVSVAIDSLVPETNEFIQPAGVPSDRSDTMIVVRLRVNGTTGGHLEEWVMESTPAGLWAVRTIRLFAFAQT